MMAYFSAGLAAFEEGTKARQGEYAGLLARGGPKMEISALQSLIADATALAEKVDKELKTFTTEGVCKDIKKLAS